MSEHFDRDYLPKELPNGATQVGEKVGYTWAGNRPQNITGLLVWHWCDHHIWREKDGFSEEYMPTPGWSPTGVGAHDLIQVEPLHLEPSVFWPGCCGLHGWIRHGQWVDA